VKIICGLCRRCCFGATAERAKERQLASLKQNAAVEQKIAQREDAGRARDIAAKAVGASHGYVSEAKKLAAEREKKATLVLDQPEPKLSKRGRKGEGRPESGRTAAVRRKRQKRVVGTSFPLLNRCRKEVA
jgi:hypothetical protein